MNFSFLLISEFFKLMNEVENEDLVFTLETIVDKFGEEMAPYALGLCQNLVILASFLFQIIYDVCFSFSETPILHVRLLHSGSVCTLQKLKMRLMILVL